jgi:RNA polymerase sigma-70 factor (ECF subfamily)
MKTALQSPQHPRVATKHTPTNRSFDPSDLADASAHRTIHVDIPSTNPKNDIIVEAKSDEALIAAYRSGDRGSFTALVSRYERELFHFLVRFLGDRAAADDVFQETFLQIHQSAELFDTHRRFRPWMFTIAANKARDLIRSNSRRPTSPLHAAINGDEDSGEFLDLMQSSEQSPDQPMQKQEMRQKVQAAITGMPENLREILLLSYFHQFPYQQISDILDIPLGTVKSRLHSAVAYFAEKWKSANPGSAQA